MTKPNAGAAAPPRTRRPRHWFALGLRLAGLLWRQGRQGGSAASASPGDLVRDSYDRIAPGYDSAWTSHMRDLTAAMLDRLAPPPGAACLDLACGTGFVTGELARRTGCRAIGVDASAGMLAVARSRQGKACKFVHSDALAFLRACPPRHFDVITCAWGLGYTRPWATIRQSARVLRPGGRLGIIDNSLFSLAGVLWSALLTFAERPRAMAHVMNFRFLPGGWMLAAMMRAAGLAVAHTGGGARTYHVADGRSAVERLTATGAAAGFEFAADPAERDAVFARFAEIVEQRCRTDRGVAVIHRYLAAIGCKHD